jgi:hypothetical protein
MTGRQLVRTVRMMLASAIVTIALASAAHAQQVYWDAPDALGAGQRNPLSLVFSDTVPAGRVVPPQVDGLTVLGSPSEQSSTTIVNGRRTSRLTITFPVRAEHEGTLTIPPFQVETSAGPRTVAPVTLQVGAATLPGSGRHGSGAKVADIVEARLTPTNMTPYAGEVFDVDATIGLTGGRGGQVIGTPSWDKSGLISEPWGEGKSVSTRNGSGVRFHTRAVAPQPGRIEVAPIRQEVEIETGRTQGDPFEGFGNAFGGALRKFGGSNLLDSFFSRAQTTSATVQSNAAQLDVRPLPPAPPGFSGAVGQFELSSHMVPEHPATGEPITWTLTLQGTGNWSAVNLPARAVPTDFRTLQPKEHKEFADGALFTGSASEDLVLVPDRPGDYALEPVRFTYFDPAAGQYRTVEARPPTLHITGAPIAPQPAAAPQPIAAAHAAPAVAADRSASAPLPHDPLRGNATGLTPIPARVLARLAALPAVLLVVYWLGLAVQHARRNDPRRPQRDAFRALADRVAHVRLATTAGERIKALLAWQRTAAVALGLDRAAATAQQLTDARWAEVWAGSEQALFGRAHELPRGWCDRALALCTRTRRPRFNPLRALSVRHLIPKAAAAALLLALAAAPARAGDGVDAYVAGDFNAAREQLLARVTDAPADWIARYNLGLAEAQRGDAPRALGETLAAFVQAPRHADVRWNTAAFAARVPGFDRAAAALLAAPALVTAVSPASWQMLVGSGALLFSIGGALAVRRRYRTVRGRAWLAPALLVLGGVLTAGSALALRAYGTLGDPRAAVVAGQPVLRSVPTDAETAQQQKPLPAGTLVVVEQDFLGWVKVGLRDGETGWVRHGDLVPLYAAPSA